MIMIMFFFMQFIVSVIRKMLLRLNKIKLLCFDE
jgi:hypothetical protein